MRKQSQYDIWREFHREVRVWEAAIADEGETEDRVSKLRLARSNEKIAYSKLHGRDAWQAQQLVKGEKRG